MGKNKDNPVPSLDNVINWISNINVPQVFTHELRQDIIENLEELQNGVETNKEQPDKYEGLNGDNNSYFRK